MNSVPFKELVVLLADLDAENAMKGILSRHQSLCIPALQASRIDLHRHVQRDPGCYNDSVSFLRPFLKTHRFALVIFDRHGSGAEQSIAEEIERHVENRLSQSGWGQRCAAVVPDPELEIWIWSDSPVVDKVLGWSSESPSLREWLVSRGLLKNARAKPDDPKKAMRESMRRQQTPVSARLFRELADQVSLDRCQDRAFQKLRRTLQTWFPQEEVRGGRPDRRA